MAHALAPSSESAEGRGLEVRIKALLTQPSLSEEAWAALEAVPHWKVAAVEVLEDAFGARFATIDVEVRRTVAASPTLSRALVDAAASAFARCAAPGPGPTPHAAPASGPSAAAARTAAAGAKETEADADARKVSGATDRAGSEAVAATVPAAGPGGGTAQAAGLGDGAEAAAAGLTLSAPDATSGGRAEDAAGTAAARTVDNPDPESAAGNPVYAAAGRATAAADVPPGSVPAAAAVGRAEENGEARAEDGCWGVEVVGVQAGAGTQAEHSDELGFVQGLEAAFARTSLGPPDPPEVLSAEEVATEVPETQAGPVVLPIRPPPSRQLSAEHGGGGGGGETAAGCPDAAKENTGSCPQAGETTHSEVVQSKDDSGARVESASLGCADGVSEEVRASLNVLLRECEVLYVADGVHAWLVAQGRRFVGHVWGNAAETSGWCADAEMMAEVIT